MAAEHCSLTFEELYKLLVAKEMSDRTISLLIGIHPLLPATYLGPKASGLPMQTVISIFDHLTYKGRPILINYPSEETMRKDQQYFEGLIGDAASLRSLGWYKGSENFTLEVCDV